MNESKIRDPRMWAKWEKSGAIGTHESSLLGAGLAIEAIGEHYAGPAAGNSTLSLGSKIICEGVLDGKRWSASKPVLAVIAPGFNYKLGQVLRRLPEGTQSITSVFGANRRAFNRFSKVR